MRSAIAYLKLLLLDHALARAVAVHHPGEQVHCRRLDQHLYVAPGSHTWHIQRRGSISAASCRPHRSSCDLLAIARHPTEVILYMYVQGTGSIHVIREVRIS
jgi:hypothetical protein